MSLRSEPVLTHATNPSPHKKNWGKFRFYDWKRVMRSMGYDGIMQDRGRTSGAFIVNATFWKMDRARLVSVEHRTRAVITGLQLVTGKRVLVANCHLEGNPLRPQDRIAQIRNVLAVLSRMQQEADHARTPSSVVICGDLNCERDSTVYRRASGSPITLPGPCVPRANKGGFLTHAGCCRRADWRRERRSQ